MGASFFVPVTMRYFLMRSMTNVLAGIVVL